MVERPTDVLIVQLQKVAFLVQLVGVTIQEGENRLQLREGLLVDIHEGRLVGIYHRRRARTVSRSPNRA